MGFVLGIFKNFQTVILENFGNKFLRDFNFRNINTFLREVLTNFLIKLS